MCREPTRMVPMEGVEPTHPYGYQILSLARLPIPPHRPSEPGGQPYSRKEAPCKEETRSSRLKAGLLNVRSNLTFPGQAAGTLNREPCTLNIELRKACCSGHH